MDKQEALEISLLLWNDIVENNLSLKHKSKYNYLVKDFLCMCPLCELFFKKGCCNCCLNDPTLCGISHNESAYSRWTLKKEPGTNLIILQAIENEYKTLYGDINYNQLHLKYKIEQHNTMLNRKVNELQHLIKQFETTIITLPQFQNREEFFEFLYNQPSKTEDLIWYLVGGPEFTNLYNPITTEQAIKEIQAQIRLQAMETRYNEPSHKRTSYKRNKNPN